MPRENWSYVSEALRKGLRGLPGGSSLFQLLAKRRGQRNPSRPPKLRLESILRWADEHRKRTGAFPIETSGRIAAQPDELWKYVDHALRIGLRGLPGGSSLPRLLAEHRGYRNRKGVPPYSIAKILRWADSHQRRTGRYPTLKSGKILDAPGETWLAVHSALQQRGRGLPGGSSLAQLLAAHRGVRNKQGLPPLTVHQILEWADEHKARTGNWPKYDSGAIARGPGETWNAVESALRDGRRGLPGGSSLSRLLVAHRGVRNKQDLPPLMVRQILEWADEHNTRTGNWPTNLSGAIALSPGDSWAAVDGALRGGWRGLSGGSSVSRLLRKHGRARRYERKRR